MCASHVLYLWVIKVILNSCADHTFNHVSYCRASCSIYTYGSSEDVHVSCDVTPPYDTDVL